MRDAQNMGKFLHICPSFEGLLVFKGKKLHNDKFSSLEGSNRAKSKLEQMQRRSAIVQGVRRDPRMYVEVDRRARGLQPTYVSVPKLGL